MAAGQRRRWATFHATQKAERPKAAVNEPAKPMAKAAPKRKMSAATKKKLVENLKKARAAKAAKAAKAKTA